MPVHKNVFPLTPRNLTDEDRYWSAVRSGLIRLSREPGQDRKRLFELAMQVPNIDEDEIPSSILENINDYS